MKSRPTAREEKLARALRDNLKRRKQALRMRPEAENADRARKADEEE